MLAIALQLSRAIFAAAILAISMFAVSSLIHLSAFPPDRPTPKKDPPPIDLSGPSQWGEITHDKRDLRKFTISGHDNWIATGEIRKDGSILLFWEALSDGRVAPGVYRLADDGSINGAWNYESEVTVDDKGELQGLRFRDTLRVARTPDA